MICKRCGYSFVWVKCGKCDRRVEVCVCYYAWDEALKMWLCWKCRKARGES